MIPHPMFMSVWHSIDSNKSHRTYLIYVGNHWDETNPNYNPLT